MKKNAVLLLLSLLALCNCPIYAADKDKDPDYIMDTSKIGEQDEETGCVRSDQLLELGDVTPSALTMEGEQALKRGNLTRALTVLQRAVELAPMDVDSRIAYAQALEKMLFMQKEKKDPKLYNFIIKQWFYVFQKADYLDQKMLGLTHVQQLTGELPKRFEKPQKFLARILIPEDGSVAVVIGGTNPNKKKIAKNLDPDKDFKNEKME